MNSPETLSVLGLMLQAKQDVPDKPTVQPLKIRQYWAALIMEEAIGTINRGLGLRVAFDANRQMIFADESQPDLIALAWGCVALRIAALRTQLTFGVAKDAVFQEVIRAAMTRVAGTYSEPNITASMIEGE